MCVWGWVCKKESVKQGELEKHPFIMSNRIYFMEFAGLNVFVPFDSEDFTESKERFPSVVGGEGKREKEMHNCATVLEKHFHSPSA